MIFTRYAVFYVPPADAEWARICTSWLGWDLAKGASVAYPNVADLPLPISEITKSPRKYGLHATLKPPFRLTSDQTEDTLRSACAAVASDQKPVTLERLVLTRMGRFLALCPDETTDALNTLAARCVSELDVFRQPSTPAELDQRRGSGLSVRQEHNLVRWGYPHVMDLFRFHITLTGRLPKDSMGSVELTLNDLLAHQLPEPCDLSDLALVGEDSTGQFHLIERYPLAG